MMRLLNWILFLTVFFIGLAFTVINADPVQLNYYFGSQNIPLSLVIVGVLAVGSGMGILATTSLLISQRREVGRLKKNLKLMERELSALRTIPIKDEK